MKKRKGKQERQVLCLPQEGARGRERRVGILSWAAVSRKTYSFRLAISPSPILHLSWSWEGCPPGTKGDVGTRALTLLAVKEIGATLMLRTQAKDCCSAPSPVLKPDIWPVWSGGEAEELVVGV